jgi:hypothetical protein
MAGPTDTLGTPGGGPNVAPVPPEQAPAGATEAVNSVNQLISLLKDIQNRYTATTQIISNIMQQMPALQIKIIQSMPPTETAAPPV